jgi:hypothetical protein
MDLLLIVVSVLFLLSALFNVLLTYKLTAVKKTAPLTTDAQKLLANIASSNAILRIDVVDPGDILLRSPKLL